MATKKQKREAGRLKAEQERAELKASGLAAQQRARENESMERKRLTLIAERMNLGHKDTIDRMATAAQKKQIEREIEEVRLDHDPVMHGQVMYHRGMRV